MEHLKNVGVLEYIWIRLFIGTLAIYYYHFSYCIHACKECRYDYLRGKICMYRVCIYLLNGVQPLSPPSSSTWLTLVPYNNVSSKVIKYVLFEFLNYSRLGGKQETCCLHQFG